MHTARPIETYFAAARAGDADKVATAFAESAWLRVMGAPRIEGRRAIAEFYRENFARETPNPKTAPPRVDGHTVTVDIELVIGGQMHHIRDVFTIMDGHITSLDVLLRQQ